MINYFVSKNVKIFSLEYDGLEIYTNNSKHFSINELENLILKKLGINIKLAFKNIEDAFPEYGLRCNTDNIKGKNIIENKLKVVHHDHSLEKNNILGFICRECNLKIRKRDYNVPLYFFNGMKYDNSILLKTLCDNFKNYINFDVIGSSCEQFKMISFRFKDMKYGLKLLDICNFLKGNLNDLSKNLPDKYKIITKKHFPNHFELLKKKAHFPYKFINKENIYDKKLPLINSFYSSLKLNTISRKDYEQTLKIYKKLKCKNIKEYFE